MMDNYEALVQAFKNSPYPSTKINSFFSAYAELFSDYRGKNCTFIETGVLAGGSLFMWREWLGSQARIIGVDLNPGAQKWREHGFEIFIGDQGSPEFWQETLAEIGSFDVLLDDGGHQSFQQMVTAQEAIHFTQQKSIVVIEDTHTSFMSDFSSHGEHTFHRYAKDSTDALTARNACIYPSRFDEIKNQASVDHYNKVHSIQFFPSLIAFKVDPSLYVDPAVIWNKKENIPMDYRHQGRNQAEVTWPDPFQNTHLTIKGS